MITCAAARHGSSSGPPSTRKLLSAPSALLPASAATRPRPCTAVLVVSYALPAPATHILLALLGLAVAAAAIAGWLGVVLRLSDDAGGWQQPNETAAGKFAPCRRRQAGAVCEMMTHRLRLTPVHSFANQAYCRHFLTQLVLVLLIVETTGCPTAPPAGSRRVSYQTPRGTPTQNVDAAGYKDTAPIGK